MLQAVIDDTRRNGKEMWISWLDLSNAFGSIPHSHIKGTLELMGVPEALRLIIEDLYVGASTTIRTRAGRIQQIPI